MRNTVLRMMISIILLSLISGVIVAIIGLILGWKTSTQFSNGFFWGGAIMIVFGLCPSRDTASASPIGRRSS